MIAELTVVRHYKGGLYRILFHAKESTNDRSEIDVVVYVSLTHGGVFVRAYDEFYGHLPDGRRRFTLVPETEQAALQAQGRRT